MTVYDESRSRAHALLKVRWVHGAVQAAANAVYGGLDHKIRALIANRLGREGPTLDVGCGTGEYTHAAPDSAIGIDINLAFTMYARRRRASSRLSFACMSATALAVRTGAFRQAFTCRLFHHLPDESVHACLDEMQRIVAPGGTVIVFDLIAQDSAKPWLGTLARLDRGRYIRQFDECTRLIAAAARTDPAAEIVYFARNPFRYGLWQWTVGAQLDRARAPRGR